MRNLKINLLIVYSILFFSLFVSSNIDSSGATIGYTNDMDLLGIIKNEDSGISVLNKSYNFNISIKVNFVFLKKSFTCESASPTSFSFTRTTNENVPQMFLYLINGKDDEISVSTEWEHGKATRSTLESNISKLFNSGNFSNPDFSGTTIHQITLNVKQIYLQKIEETYKDAYNIYCHVKFEWEIWGNVNSSADSSNSSRSEDLITTTPSFQLLVLIFAFSWIKLLLGRRKYI